MPEELEGIIDAHTHSKLSSRYQFLERKFAPALPKIEDVAIPSCSEPQTFAGGIAIISGSCPR